MTLIVRYCLGRLIFSIDLHVDYNEWLKRLDAQLNNENQNTTKVPKVIKLTNKKKINKTLGTSVINSPISPLLPGSL